MLSLYSATGMDDGLGQDHDLQHFQAGRMNADRTRPLGERFAFFNDDMVDTELFQAMREKQAYGSGTDDEDACLFSAHKRQVGGKGRGFPPASLREGPGAIPLR